MSVAKTGSSATAPPKNTASRSRLMALRISLSRHTKRRPWSIVCQPLPSPCGGGVGDGTRIAAKQATASREHTACVA